MPTALIIGAGSRVGLATAKAFDAAGYTVAVASRSGKTGSQFKHFAFDAARPDTVSGLFKEVRGTVGVPEVVVYNAYSNHMTDPDAPLGTSINDFEHDQAVNATSPWIAAGEAVKGFDELGPNDLGAAGGTFIFTGNILTSTVGPGFLTFGMGKAAAAHLIQTLALVSYPGKPYKFYFGDQRLADGSPMLTGLSGPAHAEHYLQLTKDPKQQAWLQTFVEGKGYVEFPRTEVWLPGS